MSPEASDWLTRADQALGSAELLADSDPDASASRAYYAAFYAVSALFSAEGRSFRKHSALEAAVHRDLVRAGRWPPDLGEAYTRLQLRRITGDYGGELHVNRDDARDAIEAARQIVQEVRRTLSES
ncbi:MAG TPA: HEPN domain-containing protein [Thermoanaerobaculia bacterium]|nr:HEPN domain-containing protein [Thermoanaerobaculia bacterium]